jgi:hypothetical protein
VPHRHCVPLGADPHLHVNTAHATGHRIDG